MSLITAKSPRCGGMRMKSGPAHSPDGQWLASAGKDGSIKIWDNRRPPRRKAMEQLTDECRFRFHNQAAAGPVLAAINPNGTCSLWRPRDGHELLRFDAPPNAATLALSSNLVAIGADDKTI